MRSLPKLMSGVVTLGMTGGLLLAASGIANAAYSPSAPPYPSDPNNVSYIQVYDATSGAVVTSGSATTTLNNYYFASHDDLTPGDTKAVVSGYLAVSGQQPGDFSGKTLGTSNYPITAAGTPASVSSKTTPVAKGGNSTFAQLAAAFPNTAASTSDFYELYQLRVQTTFPNGSPNYAYLDIQIDTTAGTWKQVGPAPVPNAPTKPTAVAGDGKATITFPATAGATTYTVTSSPGGFTATGPASPLTVTGLTNGTPYTFVAKATNANGDSSNSPASDAVTPASAAPPASLPEAGVAAGLLVAGLMVVGAFLFVRRRGSLV